MYTRNILHKLKEEMLHLVRVGLPQIHQCDVDFDHDGDDEGANEDNIFVSGLEQK